jgi:hypothetical protein
MFTRLPRRYWGNRPEIQNLQNFPTFRIPTASTVIISTQVKNPTVIRHNNHNNHYVSNPTDKTVIKNNITLKKSADLMHNHNTYQVPKRYECRKSLQYLQPILPSTHAAASCQQFQIFPPNHLPTQRRRHASHGYNQQTSQEM